jgi:release factor glutamine methyltransferase
MSRTLSTLLAQDKIKLESSLGLDSGESRIEVQMLLQRVLGVGRAYLFAHAEQVLDTAQLSAYEALLERRLRGEPMAYILGEREFFGLNFKVTQATLIPRPETELLVELGLQRLLPMGDRGCKLRVLDLGTGSGAIALAIAHARPDVDVVAVDASEAALTVAQENAQRLGITNASFIQSDWFAALGAQRFDLIVSNPPYIVAGDAHLAQGDARFEPLSALASGLDGLDDIRHIAAQAGQYLERGANLLLEHGYDQAAAVREILKNNAFIEVFSARDIAGIERVSVGVCG